MTRCEHCDAPVIEAIMRKSGRPVLLDPTPSADGNLQLVELGAVAQFIPTEYRDPKSRWFVPVEERFRSHLTSCTANQRTCSDDTRAFLSNVDARLAPHRAGTADPECAPTTDPVVEKAAGSADPVPSFSS